MYGINWNIFLQERVANAARKPKMLAWFNALLVPVKTLHTSFLLFKTSQERHVGITPQVRILRYWLNELYDVTERRFEIVDYANTQPLLIWGESYNSPIYLPTFLSSRAYDFTVIAHCEMYSQRVFIRAFLNAYKLAGKRYQLIFQTSGGGLCPLPAPDDFGA